MCDFAISKENNLLDKLETNRASNAEQVFKKRFANLLFVDRQGDYADVSLEEINAKLIAEWVNGFVTMVNELTAHELVEDRISKWKKNKSRLETKIDALRARISDRRKFLKREREDQIIRLEEAVRIAERIGIKDIIYTPEWGRKLGKFPIYMRGTKVLRAEALVLRERKSDDPFSSKIRNFQFQLANLQAQLVTIQSEFVKAKLALSNLSKISVSKVIQMAKFSDKPINPPVYKRLILTAVVISILFGVLAAFFSDFIVRAREKKIVQSEVEN